MIRFVIVLLFSTGLLSAQDAAIHARLEVNVGDVLEIGKPESAQYRYIDIPRANFIIKKGGIADFKLLVGEKVKVVSIKEQRDGLTKIKIKRADGRRFFGSHALIGAEFEHAMESGELLAVK
jgi:hypothetical protein